MKMRNELGWLMALWVPGVVLGACSSESVDTGVAGAGGSVAIVEGGTDTGGDVTTDADAAASDADAAANDADAAASDADAAACVMPDLAACTGLAPVALADLCATFADALCSLYMRCGYVSASELNGCKTVLADCGAPTAEVNANRIAYDGAQAACCFKRVKQDDSCQVGLAAFSFDPSCKAMFAGKVPVGGDCYMSNDCAGNARCNVSTCPGKCQSQVVANTIPDPCLGEPCVAGQACATGLVCVVNGDAGTRTCQLPPKLGESCDVATAACDGTSTCDFDFDAGTARCVAPKTAGGSCYYDANCAAGFYCQGASFTDRVAGMCTATTPLGAVCDPNDAVVCGRLYACQVGTSRCGSDPKVGELCSMSYDTCVDSYCAAIGDAGLGICTALLPGGAVCEHYWQCASGRCIFSLVGTDGGVADGSTDGSTDASTDGSANATEGGTGGGPTVIGNCTDLCGPPP